MKEIDITGFIGHDIQPQEISALLKSAENDEIIVNLVSPGGYVYEGFQIRNMIKDYPGKKTVVMNGLVASISAYISTAFDRIKVRDNSVFMIHNAMGGAIGDYRILEKEAKELKRLNEVIGQAYAKKTNKTTNEILDMMGNETWFYGNEIVDAGFGDEIIDTQSNSNKIDIVNAAKEKYKSIILAPRADDIKKAAALITDKQVNKSPGVAGRNNKLGGTSTMDKTEVFKILNALITNAQTTLPEIAEALNMKDKLVTSEHTKAIEIINAFNEMKVSDPVAEFKKLKEDTVKNNEALRNAKLDVLFGEEDDENELRYYMGKETKNLYGKELEDKINAMKDTDLIARKLIAERADITSSFNAVDVARDVNKNRNDVTAEKTGTRVDKL